MLAELAHTLLSLPGAPPAHWRHVPAAVGLWARGRRQQRAWAPHLARTRAEILAAMPPGRGTAVVLGSGPLFDVPLAEIGARYSVVLVDRVHLRSAQRQRGSAKLLWRDLADGLGGIPHADWVISVNLLSQLAHGVPEGDERSAVDRHLDALSALPCPVTLITDTTFERRDRQNRVLKRVDLLHGRKLPKPDARWTWEVAPFGEEAADTRRIHEVVAFRDWHRSG